MSRISSRRVGVIALSTVAALALASCSSGGNTASQAPSGSPTGSSMDFSGQTLNVSAAWSGAEQTNFEAVLKKFSDETGAKVNYTTTATRRRRRLAPRSRGANPRTWP